jgi:hypothetical protein
MAPSLLRDLARVGTVPVAMAHAMGELHALPGFGDGGAAVPIATAPALKGYSS